jgi:alanyl-tRNA synthetase
MTIKLFQKDVYQRECVSTVLEVQGTGTEEDPYRLILDETIFFPEGGGQPCDLGTIDGISIKDVTEKDGVIYHTMLPAESGGSVPHHAPIWEAGEKVACVLDWARRFENMQRHCGEHILSGIFFRETGGVNRGFHMGSDYMTIDIDVPGITWEQAQLAEALANEVIWANVPVTVRYFESRSEAEELLFEKLWPLTRIFPSCASGRKAIPPTASHAAEPTPAPPVRLVF